MAAATLWLPSTPESYHKIVSPLLHIPTDPLTSVPVGILACQRDPLLRELQTSVVSCSISHSSPAPGPEKGKKAPTSPSNPTLEVILHDTVIFPEGGGQPSDIGTITTTDAKVWDVVQAKRRGGHAIHYVRLRGAIADDITAAVNSFATGSEVLVALGPDGMSRRHDHMCMHTSQHMLSALLETRLKLPTLSWSLTAYPTPCYVEIPRMMTTQEILSIQDEANKLVFEGRSVHVEVQELNAEEKIEVKKLENGRSVGKALPADYTGGVKRTVIIDGVDSNPCCGTHAPSLHNLQMFLLPHTDVLSRSNTSSARLYFLTGPRLIAHLMSSHGLLTSTASLLSCGAPLIPERVDQVIDERKKAEKRVGELETELAGLVAQELLRKATAKTKNGTIVTHYHRTDNSTTALSFLSALSSACSEALLASSVQKQFLLILSSSPSLQTQSSTSVVLIIGSKDKIVKEAGDVLKAKLGIKGGGKGAKWSGKFMGVWKNDKEGAAVDNVLDSVVTQTG